MTKERPILFSAPMVRAILDGSKTQTRRVVKDLHGAEYNDFASWSKPAHVLDAARKHGGFGFSGRIYEDGTIGSPFSIRCPYGQPGDRLWVRETFALDDNGHNEWPVFRADGAALPVLPSTRKPARWVPSIHMPRWASRILLEIVSVRVERLQDISENDIKSEGIDLDALYDAQEHYDIIAKGDECWTGRPTLQSQWQALWETINGVESWAANPWVWCISFRRVE